jgi:Holliday junction resolvase
MNSRNKGQRGERDLGEALRAIGLPGQRSGQTCGFDGVPDVVTLPGIHIECKYSERLAIYDAMSQAECDAAGGAVPVVCHRRNRSPWRLTVNLSDLPRLAQIVSQVSPPPSSAATDPQEPAT